MTVAPQSNPTVARRELAVFFRSLREQRKHSLDELAGYLGVAASQASRLDTGARGYRVEDVEKLSTWYDLAEADRKRLLALAEESRRRSWWQQVEVAPAYRTLIGMELAAVSINEYCGSVMPGLLQTRDYAEAAAAAGAIDVQPEKIHSAAAVRMRRQEVLERDPPPQLWVVMDEAALARVAGGREIMLTQLQHLHSIAMRPNITVQVIGFEYGLHPGLTGHFILLGMDGSLPDVVYKEDQLESSDSSLEENLRFTRRLWDSLRALALSPRDSLDRIMQYAERLAN